MANPRKNDEPREWNVDDAGESESRAGAPETAPDSVHPTGVDPGDLEARVARAEGDLADMQAKYLRTLADYQNSHRRALANEQEARVQARTGVVQSVLSVLDHFDLALGQDMAKASAEQIVSGVKVIRDELMKVLQSHGVGVINPAPGEEFNPDRHQAIMQQAAKGIDPGHVVATYQVGFTISTGGAERVVRPAKVAVAP